jgi:hypothetical protein
MAAANLDGEEQASSVFLVERYLPPTEADHLLASVARAARLCVRSTESPAEAHIHYLASAYFPTEDTCFCFYRAATADAVRALNAEAEFALDRITAGVLLFPEIGA